MNPEVVFRAVATDIETGDSQVFLCENCLNFYGFRKDARLATNDTRCYIEGCLEESLYMSYIAPEFLVGFKHHDLL
jgi:hypothetical protein